MPATVEQVIQDVLSIIGEVAGAGVQTYSEDRIRGDVRRGFNLIRGKFAWPHMAEWITITLDESAGLSVADDALAHVPGIEDIYRVCFPNSNVPIPRLPHTVNPNTLTSGASLRYWSFLPVTHASYAGRRLRFYPLTATGDVDIYAGIYPIDFGEEWADDDTMDFDRDMLAHAAAYFTLANDGLNAEAAAANLALMEMKFRDVTAALQRLPLAVGPSSGAIPMEWQP